MLVCCFGQKRSSLGSMLLLAFMVFGIVLCVFLAGLVFFSLGSVQQKTQRQAEQIALTLAQSLNAGDRLGQMNNLVATSRELVFSSRANQKLSEERYKFLQPLALQLLNESRSSAQLVERERQKLSQCILNETSAFHEQMAVLDNPKGMMRLPWMKSNNFRLANISLGYIKGVMSNVESTHILALWEHDAKKNYYEPKSGLYLANIDAKLPSPDSDLPFKLSSLPAPVSGMTAQARRASSGVFQSLGQLPGPLDQLPSAVQLVLLVKVSTGELHGGEGEIRRVVTATSGGASPPP